MPDLAELLPQAYETGATGLVEGVVSRAPSSLSDPVYVTIPSFSRDHFFGPCVWQPRGTTLPQVGTRCLVAFDENEEPWVAAWEGDTTFPAGGGSDANYVHTQSTAASTWTINHNLGKFPAVTVVDIDGLEVSADVTHSSVNTVVIAFSGAMSGSAYLN